MPGKKGRWMDVRTRAAARINWHGVFAVLLIAFVWCWWFRHDCPKPLTKPPQSASATTTATASSGTEPPPSPLEQPAKPATTTTTSTSGNEGQEQNYPGMDRGWYWFFVSVVYALLIVASSEASPKKPLANHRIAFGAHLFVVVAFVALGLQANVSTNRDNDFYVFSFLVALSMGEAIPHLLCRGAGTETSPSKRSTGTAGAANAPSQSSPGVAGATNASSQPPAVGD